MSPLSHTSHIALWCVSRRCVEAMCRGSGVLVCVPIIMPPSSIIITPPNLHSPPNTAALVASKWFIINGYTGYNGYIAYIAYRKWTADADYLFFRNVMPDKRKLSTKLADDRGTCMTTFE